MFLNELFDNLLFVSQRLFNYWIFNHKLLD